MTLRGSFSYDCDGAVANIRLARSDADNVTLSLACCGDWCNEFAWYEQDLADAAEAQQLSDALEDALTKAAQAGKVNVTRPEGFRGLLNAHWAEMRELTVSNTSS